jgi:glycosyltransferase involved in cell wall biosynthesis
LTCSVVIPAHNEASTIGTVIEAAAGFDVIVVADACTDATAAVARGLGARVIEIDAGDKGTSMAAGLAAVGSDDVLFLDADVRGLTSGHVQALAAAPPLGGMVVGLRDGAPPTGLPPISGERRLPTAFARSVRIAGTGYRAELLIDAAAARAGLPHRHYRLIGVTNPSREWRHPLMWADLAVTAVANGPALVRYVVQAANCS